MRTSESIASISAALVAFQAETSNPKHSAVNPHFRNKYTPLHDIINHIRPALAKHGLAVLQNPHSEDGQSITITTRLMHTSGEWIETDPLVLRADKATPQGAGAAITYGRRYSLSAILGISSEDDDDGNSAEPKKQAPPKQQREQKQEPPKQEDKPSQPAQQGEGFISVPRAKRMFALASGNADIVRQVLAEYNIEASNQVPNSLYDEICDKIQILVAEAKEGANNESS